MKTRRQTLALMIVLAVVTVWAVTPAGATSADMAQLPMSTPFACLNCHLVGEPVAGDAVLNGFGTDFLDAGRDWTVNLARLDSDDDGCLNGAELGDIDGNGEPDVGVNEESSNPGRSDCSSAAVNEMLSWTELKNLFNGR